MNVGSMTVKSFLDELASDAPVPGGGGVSALCAALGAALVSMVANLTVGKEKHRDNWAAMEETLKKSNALVDEFLELVNSDAECFGSYMSALKMERGSEEERAARKSELQRATKQAALVPLRMIEACSEMSKLALDAALYGNPNVATDAGIAALLAEAGGVAASYNVRINLMSITDEYFRDECSVRMSIALGDTRRNARKVSDYMNEIL